MHPITHIASEFAPVAKVGGMGDVTYGLAMEQSRQGDAVRMILPLYASVDIPLSRYTSVDINQKKIDIYRAKWLQFELFFVDLPELFRRDRIYGCIDDAKRFATFAYAAAKLAIHLKAPFVHLHDWQTALATLILKQEKIPTLYTIHNLFHQGKADTALFDKLGLQNLKPKTMQCNLMQLGIDNATLISTVSPTYANEILTPPLSCGLEESLNKRKDDIHGILNGIDIESWDPKKITTLKRTSPSTQLQK